MPKLFKLIFVTDLISHFEVPLFRLLSQIDGIEFDLLYSREIGEKNEFDPAWQQKVDWAVSLKVGYNAIYCPSSKHLVEVLNQLRPEMLILYGYRGPFLGRALLYGLEHNIPLGLRATANYQLDRRSPWKSLLRPLAIPIFRLFQTVHYGGRMSYRYYRLMGVPKHRLFFVPYSVDTPYFLKARERLPHARKEVRRKLGFPADAFVVLFVGQLSWFKGPDMALHVFRRLYARLPHARFLVVGDGVMRKELEAEAHALLPPGVVQFVGFQNQQTIPAYYLAADVAIFTSRYETWGRAANECLACGLPCIVTNRMGAAYDLVQNGVNGYVITYGKWSLFVKKLYHLACNNEIMSQLSIFAVKNAILFSYERSLADLLLSLNKMNNNIYRSSYFLLFLKKYLRLFF
jgi:glycosyltransferase involved in cell wall biosynthesis